MNERDLAGKIVRHLDSAADGLSAETLARLQVARRNALARYAEVREPASGIARAGELAARLVGGRWLAPRHLVATAALILGLLGVVYWQATPNHAGELAEIDAGLLTDELPINAYLDKGFDAWLKRPLR